MGTKSEIGQHGTQGMYNNGCRCKACTQARSASAWAARQVANWDEPIGLFAIRGETHYTKKDKTDPTAHAIPSWLIVQALKRNQRQIKRMILEEFWVWSKKKG
jgi:hypothetical protein